MRNALLLSLWMMAGTGMAAEGVPEVVRMHIPDAQAVGGGRYTFLLFDAYEATLYAPRGRWRDDRPYALELHYLREIDGEDIAERSVEEIRKQGYRDEVRLAAWFAQLRGVFPDVEDGTRLVGVYVPQGPTVFYRGREQIGIVQDAEFGPRFFHIWLGQETSAPKLRRQLLDLK